MRWSTLRGTEGGGCQAGSALNPCCEFRRAKSRVCVALVVTALAAGWLTPGTSGQNPQKKPAPKNEPQQQQGGMGGISSAGTFAPVYDAQKHPITAGGFVDKGAVVFEDATKAAGLNTWRHVMGTQKKKYILETDGSGVGLIDYDNDGWLDIYLVNGSTYEALSGKSDTTACRAVSQQP